MDWVGGSLAGRDWVVTGIGNKRLSYGTVGQEQKEQKLQKILENSGTAPEIRRWYMPSGMTWPSSYQLTFSLGKPPY